MRIIGTIALLVVFFTIPFRTADALDGKYLFELCSSDDPASQKACTHFMLGVIETIMAFDILEVCILVFNADNVRQEYLELIRTEPDRLDQNAAGLIVFLVQKKFPCD